MTIALRASPPWLGTLPPNWVLSKLRHVVRCLDGRRIPLNSSERSDRQGSIPYWGANGVLDHVDKALFAEPLVLLGEDGAPFFDRLKPVAFFVTEPVWVNNHAHVLRPIGVAPKYLMHALNITDYADFIEGSTRDKLTQGKMNSIPVPLPPLLEQEAIASFLDSKTAAIDALLTKKERLIELLQEKRQALITKAVTKGLDPKVPMKESGVAWLGVVPSHWTVHELRHRIRRIEQGWSPSCESREAEEGEWGVLKVGCVNYGGFRDTENKALPLDLEPLPELEVHAGDVLVSRANTRELVGSAAYVERTRSRLLLCDKLFRIHYRPADTDPQFLVLLLQSDLCRFQLEREATGASGSMQNIGQDSVRRLLFGWAPLEEQRQLVTHVGARTARIDALKSQLEAHIEKLREYRHALITAAVTGKIDVSKEAA